jgi:2-phospho-L-lactate guanylyltransferase
MGHMTDRITAGEWVIVVPVKQLDRAKTRLFTRATTVRRELALAFSLDVVSACLASQRVHTVFVVTPDDTVSAAVLALGATVVPQRSDEGLNDSLIRGSTAAAAASPHRRIGLLAADLPALRTHELDLALAESEQWDRCFVADVAGTGTTFVAVAPGISVQPRFGPRSRAAHAQAGFIELTTPELARIRCDVDTEVDLWYAQLLGVGRFTAVALPVQPA